MTSPISLQPQRGFRDIYPSDKTIQNSIFEKIRRVGYVMGFEEYDGPLVEPISLYTEKSSAELVGKQTFRLITREGKEEQLVLRPEMTPSLARMVAKKSQELVYPLRFMNIGLRFRYEAPQKGREREFYQMDFDILGVKNILADAEIIKTAVMLMTELGATETDFKISINSRSIMEQKFDLWKLNTSDYPKLLALIDKKDKMDPLVFSESLKTLGFTDDITTTIQNFLDNPNQLAGEPYFQELFSYLMPMGYQNSAK